MTTHSNPYLVRLQELELEGNSLRVAVVGAGDFGETLVAQLDAAAGLVAALVCDLDVERAVSALRLMDPARRVSVCQDEAQVAAALAAGDRVAVSDSRLVPTAAVDVVVDSTGDPEGGCELALAAIDNGLHVVMVNAEADATAGWLLAERAASAGVVYTLADGDQPSLLCGLVDWARLIGFEVVSAGKWGKRFASDEAARLLATKGSPTPSDVTNLDGSKTQIEMAAAANAAGLSVDRAGMHGLPLSFQELPERLRPKAQGGVLERTGVVDYVNILGVAAGQAHPGGVWAVVTSDSERVMKALAAKRVPVSSDGKHALLFRVQHLVGAETIRSIVLAALAGRPTAAARQGPLVEVVAVAKRDLSAGESLTGLGGGDIAAVATPAAEGAGHLPAGLAAGCRLTRAVGAGERLSLADVEPRGDSLIWRLRFSEPHSTERYRSGAI